MKMTSMHRLTGSSGMCSMCSMCVLECGPS